MKFSLVKRIIHKFVRWNTPPEVFFLIQVYEIFCNTRKLYILCVSLFIYSFDQLKNLLFLGLYFLEIYLLLAKI